MSSTRSALIVGIALLIPVAGAAQETLNALVWCDHTDPALIAPFEEAHDVRVNLREYEGTGAALSLIEQSQPGGLGRAGDRRGRRSARGRGGYSRAAAGRGAAARRSLPRGADGGEQRGRRDLVRDDREVRLQHHLVQQGQGRPGRHDGSVGPVVGQIRGADRDLRLLPAGDRARRDLARQGDGGADRRGPARDRRAPRRDAGGGGAGERRRLFADGARHG